MTATNAAGSNTAIKTGYITVSAAQYSQPSSNSDSPPSSTATGGPVGGTTTSTTSGATATISFNQVTSPTSPVAVAQLQIVPAQNIGAFQMIAQPVNLGTALQVTDRTVAGYLQIHTIGLNPTAIDHGIITFEVSETWLTDHNIDPAAVVLMTYQDTIWSELPTQFSHQTGNAYYFSATTPHFSYFAITVKPDNSSINTVTPTVTVTEMEMRIPIYGEMVTTPDVGSTLAGAEVTTRSPGVNSFPDTQASEGNSYFPILIVTACVLIVTGAYFIWKWRQKELGD